MVEMNGISKFTENTEKIKLIEKEKKLIERLSTALQIKIENLCVAKYFFSFEKVLYFFIIFYL